MHRHPPLSALFLALIVSACGPTLPGESPPSEDEPAIATSTQTLLRPAEATAFDVTEPAGPFVLEMGSNIDRVELGKAFVVTMVLNHPAGVDAIIGGTLKSASGAIYGPFNTNETKGVYSATLTWNAINEVEPISFTKEGSRILVATFFDSAGRRLERGFQVKLSCGGADACDGKCTQLSTDATNCGGCGNFCPRSPATGKSYCVSGKCSPCAGGLSLCGNTCVDLNTDTRHCGACGAEVGAGKCVMGKPVCNGSLPLCGGKCVYTDWDNDHCGGCGKKVPAGAQCIVGRALFCVSNVIDATTCDQACRSLGKVCKEGSGDIGFAQRFRRTCTYLPDEIIKLTSCSAKAAVSSDGSFACTCQ